MNSSRLAIEIENFSLSFSFALLGISSLCCCTSVTWAAYSGGGGGGGSGSECALILSDQSGDGYAGQNDGYGSSASQYLSRYGSDR